MTAFFCPKTSEGPSATAVSIEACGTSEDNVHVSGDSVMEDASSNSASPASASDLNTDTDCSAEIQNQKKAEFREKFKYVFILFGYN